MDISTVMDVSVANDDNEVVCVAACPFVSYAKK